MTRSEFRELYKRSLFEACEKWPDSFSSDWRNEPADKVEKWVDRVLTAIPKNDVIMSNKQSSFAILCKKLGIKQAVKDIQAALASCTGDE